MRSILALSALCLTLAAASADAQLLRFAAGSADSAGGQALSPASLYERGSDGTVALVYDGGADSPLDAAALLGNGELVLSAAGPCPCTLFGLPGLAASDLAVKNVSANGAPFVGLPAGTLGLAAEDLDALGVLNDGLLVAFSVRADGGPIGGGAFPTIAHAENAAVYVTNLIGSLAVLVDFTEDFEDPVAPDGANLDSVDLIAGSESLLVSFETATPGAETLEGFAIYDEDVFFVNLASGAVTLYFDGSLAANWSGGDALSANIRAVSLSAGSQDVDGDGLSNALDNCPTTPNPGQDDLDEDDLGDACDPDIDADGVPNPLDNCDFAENPGQQDFEGDGVGDACDPDRDGDGVPDDGSGDGRMLSPGARCAPGQSAGCDDNCPFAANPGQEDSNGDGLGNACAAFDPDGDGVPDFPDLFADNCPSFFNPDQADADGDGVGDVCEEEVCGDGVRSGVEDCDDGNLESEDGCSAECHVERCGDRVLQRGLGEECDDGGPTDFDGCSSVCLLERCGDGELDPFEECDDGGNADGDGCSARCRSELECYCTDADGDGYSVQQGDCPGSPCGPEDCDDANPTVHPDAPEVPGNGVDDNCNGTVDLCGALPDGGGSARGLPAAATVVLPALWAFGLARRRRGSP